MVIGGIATIGGIIIMLTGLTAAPWPWILIGVGVSGLFIAAFLAFHRIREELDKLKDTLPSITVTPSLEGKYVRLRVQNHGGNAEFRATAQRIQKEKPIGTAWPINWYGTLEQRQRIFKTDYHILNIASRDWPQEIVPDKKPFIRFYMAKQSTGITLGEEQFIDHYDLSPSNTMAELEVTITSHPELRLPFKQRYIIRLTEDSITLESSHHD